MVVFDVVLTIQCWLIWFKSNRHGCVLMWFLTSSVEEGLQVYLVGGGIFM